MSLTNSDAITAQCEQVKWKASDIMLADSIGKLINLDEIVDRLLATDCQQCSLFTHEQVKFAFLKWVEEHIESIEIDPEWFLSKEPKHFYRNLPFDKLQENYDDGFAEMSIKDFVQMGNEMNPDFVDDESALEDDFDGTPEEAAKVALSW